MKCNQTIGLWIIKESPLWLWLAACVENCSQPSFLSTYGLFLLFTVSRSNNIFCEKKYTTCLLHPSPSMTQVLRGGNIQGSLLWVVMCFYKGSILSGISYECQHLFYRYMLCWPYVFGSCLLRPFLPPISTFISSPLQTFCFPFSSVDYGLFLWTLFIYLEILFIIRVWESPNLKWSFLVILSLWPINLIILALLSWIRLPWSQRLRYWRVLPVDGAFQRWLGHECADFINGLIHWWIHHWMGC